ncbi:MAG: THUMP domain-containing class I SAM-dependent RNA methyltransferase, partial [Chitinophagaceae bacterium]
KERIIITCNNRLSPYLQQELRDLGYDAVRNFPTGVELKGSITDCIPLNLQLRSASQVLYSLKSFQADHPDDVYTVVKEIPWEDMLTKDGYFSVTSNVQHPSVNNSLFTNLRVKDAIVDRMREKSGFRPASGSSSQSLVIHLFWKEENAEVFIDTAGESIAKHGYRKIPGQAPMLEALASSTVMATRWDRTSPFINPMSGSGTIAIEAALIATNRYPGLFRNNYSFMHLAGYDEKIYSDCLEMIKAKIIPKPELEIIASDISGRAIENAALNASAAGVRDLIRFEICDFAETPLPETESGIIFFNPEYGERLGEVEELAETYSRMGDFLKQKCKGYTGYIFTGNLDLAKKIRLNPKRRIEFYNAKIDCRLLEYELYAGTRRTDKLVGSQQQNAS